MTQHLDENAELYALGDLDPTERAAVEQHLATCAPCAQRVADAEGVVAALASTLPASPVRRSRLRASPWLVATAAVVALGFAVLGWEESALRYERATTTVALQTIVHSHFLHIMMDATSSASPNVKIIYARDGAWLYIVADAERSDLHVTLTRDGATRDAGTLNGAAGVSTLLIQNARRPTSVALRDATGITNTVTLVYPSAPQPSAKRGH